MAIFNNWLARISKRVGFNLHYFIKNGSWVALRFFIMALSGWIVSLFFARASSKEVLGQYQLILSYLSIFTVFSLPGLNQAALEAVVKGREGGVIRAVKISLFFSLFVIPVFLGWGIYDIFFKEEVLIGKILIFVGFFAPFYYAFNTWTAYYDGKAMFKEVSSRMIVINAFQVLLLIMGIFYGLGAFGLIAIYLLVNIFFFILFYIEVHRKIKDKVNSYIDIEFGVKTSIQKLVLGLSGNMPPIIIAYLFGIQPVAVYYIANYLISAASSFMGTLAVIYVPTLFKNLKLNHKNIIVLNIFAGFIFWILFIIFLKLFFVLLYGPGYSESLTLAYKISFIIILVPFKNYLITFFMTQKRNWLLIGTVGAANLIAALVLLLLRRQEYLTSVSYYIYTIEIFTSVPLLISYFSVAFKNKLTIKK